MNSTDFYHGQKKMIGWNFPSNDGGQIRGIAEAGIQTFTGKEILSLARETCQNSLDAAIDGKENIACVVFQLHEISSADIPDRDAYKKILQRCRTFWKNNAKAVTFIDAAIRQINLPKTAVLRISDYNTTGLAEPFNPRAQNGWNTLTKIDGGATKSGDAAGSFGIGKNAPFTNSHWRMIFYRTLNLQGERAAQGMARLVSFDMGDKITAGVGYFGNTEKNMPVKEIPALDKICTRKANQIGTDVFIYGFNSGDDWRDKISVELIENFLVAIDKQRFVIRIQGDDLTRATLKNFVSRYTDKLTNANDYYRALTGGDEVKICTQDFNGMGTLNLRVIVDSKAKLNRRVLVVRSNGMKIFDMAGFPRGLSFTGILQLDGFKLNEFFREMETPAHDKWEPDRHENSKLAREYLTELKRWVRDEITKLSAENFSDEVNVEGLDQMLAFDDGAIDGTTQTTFETLDALPIDLPAQKLLPAEIDDRPTQPARTRRTSGTVIPNGGLSAIRIPIGTRTRKTLEHHTGKADSDGKDIVHEPAGRAVACKKIRVIKVGGKTYRLILNVAQNIRRGCIEVFAVCENGEREKLSVTQAKSSVNVHASGDNIFFRNLNRHATIDFELSDEQNYALGVDVLAD